MLCTYMSGSEPAVRAGQQGTERMEKDLLSTQGKNPEVHTG